MAYKKKSVRESPHSRAKADARLVAALDPDAEWAQAIIRRMRADCHPYQLGAVDDPALRISFLVGRGGGKTTTLRIRALSKMVTRKNARLAYVATSRPEAERLNWEPLKQLIESLGVMDDFDFLEQKMRCICKRTGSTYSFFGADDKREINKLRGQPFDEFQVDEAASHDPVLLETMLDRAIGPRLGERKGAIVLAGSPGHLLYGRFYDVTRDGGDMHRAHEFRDDPAYAGWIGWSSHHWDMPRVLSVPDAEKRYPSLALNWAAALEEKKRQNWEDDNPIWRREYLGRWAADNTSMMFLYRSHDTAGERFNSWDPLDGKKLEGIPALKMALNKLPPEFDDWLFGYGQDLGSRDPYALNIFAFSPSDPKRRFFHVFSFGQRKMYARLIAELLIGPESVDAALRGEAYSEVGGLFGVTGWPVAIVADLAGLGETLIDELANVYGVRIKAAEKRGKMGATEIFNGDLSDGRMIVLAGSPLEEQLASLQWKPDEYGQPREDKAARNDHADSAIYIRTELGTMFSAVLTSHVELAGDKKRAPASQAKRQERVDWDDRPTRSKGKGEFDHLLSGDNFSGFL